MGRILRVIAIILLGLTMAFHLLGAVGSSCVALGAEKYASMAALGPVKWLYQLLALATLAASLYGLRATLVLAQGRRRAYSLALGLLIVTLALASVQMFASRALRGASQPNDMRVYVTLATLSVFLFLRLPGIWERVELERASGNAGGTAAGLALCTAGISALTVHLWAAPTHTFQGINYADVWHLPLSFIGWGGVIVGVALVAWANLSPLHYGACLSAGLNAALQRRSQ